MTKPQKIMFWTAIGLLLFSLYLGIRIIQIEHQIEELEQQYQYNINDTQNYLIEEKFP